MPEFDLNRFLRELKEDEGVVYRIYPDPIHGAACPTLGVGHLIKQGDKHYGLPLGTAVSHTDVETYLAGDVRAALANARRLYTDFDDLPTEVQLIIANMIFNLGYTGLSRFVKMKAAVDARDWVRAAEEMKNSKWFSQVGKRARQLVNRMRNVQ